MSDIVRVTGKLDQFDPAKPWSTKDRTRSGTMAVATIRTSDWTSIEVTVADSMVQQFEARRGQDVDVMVEVSPGGNYVRYRVTADWPTETAGKRSLSAAG